MGATLVATGRRADLDALRVASVGLDVHANTIPVDRHLRAGNGVWAIGDVTGLGACTHIVMHQAAIAAVDILGQGGPPADYRALPRVTFTDPEARSVGLTEAGSPPGRPSHPRRPGASPELGARLDPSRRKRRTGQTG